MNPETAPLLVAPAETATLTGLLFLAVEVLKSILRIEGRVSLVRGLALCLAMLFSFGDTLFNVPVMPEVTPFLCWNAFLRGLSLTAATFGIHALRSGEDPNGVQARAGAALRSAGTGLLNNFVSVERDPPPGPAGSGPEFSIGNGHSSDPIPSGEVPGYVSNLCHGFGMTAKEAYGIVTGDPATARAMLAMAYQVRNPPGGPIPGGGAEPGTAGTASPSAPLLPLTMPPPSNVTGKNDNIPE